MTRHIAVGRPWRAMLCVARSVFDSSGYRGFGTSDHPLPALSDQPNGAACRVARTEANDNGIVASLDTRDWRGRDLLNESRDLDGRLQADELNDADQRVVIEFAL